MAKISLPMPADLFKEAQNWGVSPPSIIASIELRFQSDWEADRPQ
jgi:hypothetical protein